MSWSSCFHNPMVPKLTEGQSKARVAELRGQGYRVKKIKLPDGSVAVLRSKKPLKHNPGEIKSGALFAVGFVLVFMVIGIIARHPV